jgi:hypothetical protein
MRRSTISFAISQNDGRAMLGQMSAASMPTALRGITFLTGSAELGHRMSSSPSPSLPVYCAPRFAALEDGFFGACF